MIDTGASRTAITPSVAERLSLKQVNEETISRAGGMERVATYAAAIRFPDQRFAPVRLIELIACALPNQPIECLIGRDLLGRWTFNYDGRSGYWKIEEDEFPTDIIQPDL